MDYKVEVLRVIRLRNGKREKTFSLSIYLPFAPFVGLTIRDEGGNPHEDDDDFEIEQVIWCLNSRRFKCWAKDEGFIDSEESFQAWEESFLADGWKEKE